MPKFILRFKLAHVLLKVKVAYISVIDHALCEGVTGAQPQAQNLYISTAYSLGQIIFTTPSVP